jgi:hypothetical protein
MGKGLRARGRCRLRTGLLWVAATRMVLGVVAIPLAPALYHDHFALLVLLRPTKEVLLAGGFLVRRGDVSLPVLFVAAVPILLLGVWLLFALGRLYADDIRGDRLPGLAGRLLPPKRVRAMCEVRARGGVRAGGAVADRRRRRGAGGRGGPARPLAPPRLTPPPRRLHGVAFHSWNAARSALHE